jgi:hypothetical protein
VTFPVIGMSYDWNLYTIGRLFLRQAQARK